MKKDLEGVYTNAAYIIAVLAAMNVYSWVSPDGLLQHFLFTMGTLLLGMTSVLVSLLMCSTKEDAIRKENEKEIKRGQIRALRHLRTHPLTEKTFVRPRRNLNGSGNTSFHYLCEEIINKDL